MSTLCKCKRNGKVCEKAVFYEENVDGIKTDGKV
jgi:hypothetical protein